MLEPDPPVATPAVDPAARLDPAPARRRTTRPVDRPAPSRHGPVAQLLIAWSPLSLILVVYAAAAWLSAPIKVGIPGDHLNRLGFAVHVAGPARADERLFGAVPSPWLQSWLVTGTSHWYDAVAALVYVTHFVSIPLVTALVWFRLWHRFRAWLVSVLAFTAVGVGGYVVYPAAPPWMASTQGVIGPVHRISDLGWDYLHLDPVARLVGLGQAGSNPVAAMPSLHAGAAMLVALFLWPVASRLWRVVLLTYVVLMGLALVYTGEHYVVDVLAGWVTAAVGASAGWLARRRAGAGASGHASGVCAVCQRQGGSSGV